MTKECDNKQLLLQDCNQKLFRWFLSKLDAMKLLKENCERIKNERNNV